MATTKKYQKLTNKTTTIIVARSPPTFKNYETKKHPPPWRLAKFKFSAQKEGNAEGNSKPLSTGLKLVPKATIGKRIQKFTENQKPEKPVQFKSPQ